MVFYAQSTIAVISGQCVERTKKKTKKKTATATTTKITVVNNAITSLGRLQGKRFLTLTLNLTYFQTEGR